MLSTITIESLVSCPTNYTAIIASLEVQISSDATSANWDHSVSDSSPGTALTKTESAVATTESIGCSMGWSTAGVVADDDGYCCS